jgi:hypothetical protein
MRRSVKLRVVRVQRPNLVRPVLVVVEALPPALELDVGLLRIVMPIIRRAEILALKVLEI